MIDLEALRRLKGLRIYQFFLDEKTGEITDITSRDDFVRVIRCKDCKHYEDECCDRYADETLGYVHSTQEYGYCWAAERKDK